MKQTQTDNKKTDKIDALEFKIILSQLSEFALCEPAKEKLLNLKPFLSESECKNKINETTDARKILDSIGSPPLTAMKELDKILLLVSKGSMLLPEQLLGVANFINSCKRMKSYLNRAQACNVDMATYGASFFELNDLYEEIDKCIRNGIVDDGASSELKGIRRKIENLNASAKAKLDSILRSKKEWFADGYVTTRLGKMVLPVKKEYKNQVPGSVIETSGTGSTCFIEPASVRKIQDEIAILKIDEDNEIRKILYTLTAMVDDNIREINLNRECMEILDFVFAKAKLSLSMKANAAIVSVERRICIKNGKHPLLKREECVPLNFEIGGEVRGIVITGPNTGGKTVALKTVGLLSMMAQSGLHVPAEEGSMFSMQGNVLCDIGDGQSITENLSTFSSHIKNIIRILENTTQESLVLLDELGSGTDPAEGMGIAVSILDELKKRNCLFVATTHYPEIKDYAKTTSGLINARMEFDRESLNPLYRLQIGEAGESCALYIARRLGFPEHMLKRAHAEAYRADKMSSYGTCDIKFSDDIEVQPKTEINQQSKIIREKVKSDTAPRSEKFQMGDSVMVYPQKEIGIVFKRSDEMGMIGVQIKEKKYNINHKRIKLVTPASELYPDNYDFSIIFDTVENRKARRKMDKGHHADLAITFDKNDLGKDI